MTTINMVNICARVNSIYIEVTLTQEVKLELKNAFKYITIRTKVFIDKIEHLFYYLLKGFRSDNLQS